MHNGSHNKERSTPGEQKRLISKKANLRLRARIIQAIRRFFIAGNYLEVETPHRIPAPPPETHIDAIPAGDWFLHTSPELCMKRLLSAGYEKIFQICRVYRAEERGQRHLPEFTLLEWYRTEIDYRGLMEECEGMILFVAGQLGVGDRIAYQGREIHLKRPWKRMTVNEAFRRYASVSMGEALDSGCFDELLVERIEPRLWESTFLYDYPASLAALARLKENDRELAERFELYMGGIEIANAFSELTDPCEQKKRFEEDRVNRRELGKRVYPFPDRFIEALRYMPPSAGIALGVDRLVMIFADSTDIDGLVAFTPEEL